MTLFTLVDVLFLEAIVLTPDLEVLACSKAIKTLHQTQQSQCILFSMNLRMSQYCISLNCNPKFATPEALPSPPIWSCSIGTKRLIGSVTEGSELTHLNRCLMSPDNDESLDHIHLDSEGLQ